MMHRYGRLNLEPMVHLPYQALDLKDLLIDLRLRLHATPHVGVHSTMHELLESLSSEAGDLSAEWAFLGSPEGIGISFWRDTLDRVVYDPFSRSWRCDEWATSQVAVAIYPNGRAEVYDDGFHSDREAITVRNAAEVLTVFEMLTQSTLPPPPSSREATRIDGIFLPFFRSLDDIGTDRSYMCWVRAEALRPIIDLHTDAGSDWLECMQPALEARYDRLTYRASDLAAELVAERGRTMSQLRQECLRFASSLGVDVIATPAEVAAMGQCRLTSPIDLPFRVLRSSNDFSSYIELLCNAGEGNIVRSEVERWVESGTSTRFRGELAAPDAWSQRQIWFEYSRDTAELQLLADKVSSTRHYPPYSLEEKRQITSFRLPVVQRVLKGIGNDAYDPQELKQAITPLPVFFEKPYQLWRCSYPDISVDYGHKLLEDLLKTSVLLGLEELGSGSPGTGAPFLPSAIRKSLAGKPTIGNWRRALAHLANHCGTMAMWGEWIGFLSSEPRLDQLIARRNELAHSSDSDVNRKRNESSEEQGPSLELLVGRLRDLSADSQLIVPHSRRRIDSDSVSLDCESISGAERPFRRCVVTIPSDLERHVPDGSLCCRHGDNIFAMTTYFRAVTVNHEIRQLHVYAQECSGGKALFAEVLNPIGSPQMHPLSMTGDF